MKKFYVRASVTISLQTIVMAESEEEVLEIAANRPTVSLCWGCAKGSPEVEWVTSGELDGEPVDLSVEAA